MMFPIHVNMYYFNSIVKISYSGYLLLGFHFLPICSLIFEQSYGIGKREKVGDNMYILLRVDDMERNEI